MWAIVYNSTSKLANKKTCEGNKVADKKYAIIPVIAIRLRILTPKDVE
jgi:hypothetical protein